MRFSWYWLKKKWMALLALCVSLLSLFLSLVRFIDSRQLAHLHMEPTIKCMFDFPDTGNPVFLVTNTGDIPVVSLSVAHNLYVFDRTTLELMTVAYSGNLFSDDMIYQEELKPTEYVNQDLVRFDPVDDIIAVYSFNLRYYRELDMHRFDREEIFYVDGGQVYDQLEFMQTSSYRLIMEQIEQFQMPSLQYDPGSLQEFLERLEDDN